MSQASDVETFLLRFLEFEGLQPPVAQSGYLAEVPPPLKGVVAGLKPDKMVATPHNSERSNGNSLKNTQASLYELSTASAAIFQSRISGFSPVADNNTTCEAATPSKRQRRSSSLAPERESFGSASSFSSLPAEVGKTDAHAESQNIHEPTPSLSSSFSGRGSPTPPLSLSHPVVEFLASVQLQGYAARIIEDFGLRTMPALLTFARSEANVVRLLGPYASLQQRGDLWRGLRRWEKEEARRVRVEVEERRRQQVAAVREQRQKEKKSERKKTETPRKSTKTSGGDPERADVQYGRAGGQQSFTLFTQLMDDHFFSLPNVYARSPEEITAPSASSFTGGESALRPHVVSSATTSRVDNHNSLSDSFSFQQQEQHQLPSSDLRDSVTTGATTSCMSRTTSATQLMRELTHRRAHSRRARRRDCHSESQEGHRSENSRQQEANHVRRESRKMATQTVPYDVDAEDNTEVESGTGEQRSNTDEEEINSIGRNSSRDQDKEQVKRVTAEALLATRSSSRQSSESHLSSLLCSLCELQVNRQGGDSVRDGKEEMQSLAAERDLNTSETRIEDSVCSALGAAMTYQKKTSMDLLSNTAFAATVSSPINNELVASRHISLSALSVHAELEQQPPPPPSLFSTKTIDNNFLEAAPVMEKAKVAEFIVSPSRAASNADESGGASLAVSALDVEAFSEDTAHLVFENVASVLSPACRIEAARVKLERTLRAALHAYNEEVIAARREVLAKDGELLCSGEGQNTVYNSLTPLFAVLHPLEQNTQSFESPCTVANKGDALASDRLVRWAEVSSKFNNTAEPDNAMQSTKASSRRTTPNKATQTLDCTVTNVDTQPSLSATSVDARPLHSYTICASPYCNGFPPASLYLPSSGCVTTATDTVPASLSNADISARTTARPTALPCVDAGCLSNIDHSEESTNLLEAELMGAAGSHEQTLGQRQRGHVHNSRSWSTTELTASTQGERLHLTSCHEMAICEAQSRGASAECLCGSAAISNAEQGGLGVRHVDESRNINTNHLCNEEPVWVEEEGHDGNDVYSSPPLPLRETSLCKNVKQSEEGNAASEKRRESSGQDWWDLYGIDALEYTQNCMDDLPPKTHHNEAHDALTASQRGTSPAVKPGPIVEKGRLVSPPIEVVEVTSSDEDVEALGQTLPDRSRSPLTTHTATHGIERLPSPQISSIAAPELSRYSNESNNQVSLLSSGVADCVFHRLQPSLWCRMTNAELRELCDEFGLAVRPVTTRAAANATFSPPMSSLQYCPSRNSPRRVASPSRSPEWASQYGLEGLQLAIAGSVSGSDPFRVSPRTCRELFQQDRSGCISSPSPSVHSTEEAVVKENGAVIQQQLHTYDSNSSSAWHRDRRIVRMEREALLEALQLLAARLRFRHCVAPFFLHRVERFSGLPYKRVRAADLLDEGSVLTREHLQQARQRYKAEEQTEVERCVLAALAAEAVESVESYAQHVIGMATVAAGTSLSADETAISQFNVSNGGSDGLLGSPLQNASTTEAVPALACYDQILLREPVSVEAVTSTVQRSFPHVTHTRVQQLLTLNEVIAEIVVTCPRRSPTPLPSTTSVIDGMSAAEKENVSSTVSLVDAANCSPSRDAINPQEAPTLSQEVVRRANTRRFFAQRGYMTRRGPWGRGSRRGGGGG